MATYVPHGLRVISRNTPTHVRAAVCEASQHMAQKPRAEVQLQLLAHHPKSVTVVGDPETNQIFFFFLPLKPIMLCACACTLCILTWAVRNLRSRSAACIKMSLPVSKDVFFCLTVAVQSTCIITPQKA